METTNSSAWHLFANHTEFEAIIFSVSGSCAFLSLVLTFFLVYRHLKHYYEPHAQRPIIRILLMVPIYSVASFLAILFAPYALYFNLVRDCYEAYVLYQFLCLLTHYYDSEGGAFAYELVDLGGRGDGEEEDDKDGRRYSIGAQLKKEFERQRLPFPLCCLFYTPGNTLMTWIRRLALQYVFFKLVLSIVAIILALTGVYHAGSFSPKYGFFWITLLLNLSAIVAFYAIVIFYALIARTISAHKPLLKFLSIKLLIFFCFWQTLAIGVLYYFDVLPAFFGWTKEQSADVIQNVLICGEMVGIAILNFWAFSYRAYRSELPVHTLHSVGKNIATDILNPLDLVRETKEAFGTPRDKENDHRS